MDEEAEKAAIMEVLKAETGAWMRRDFAALQEHWVHSPQTRRMTSFASLGTQVAEGWDTIAARMQNTIERSGRYGTTDRLSWDRVNIVVGKDMAWVSYDQIGSDSGDGFELAGVQHELKIFQRIDGAWKIGCLVILQQSVERANCPLIEVDPGAKVLWMNRLAHARIGEFPGLAIAAGHLRARRRDRKAALSDALEWAFQHLKGQFPPTGGSRKSRAVPLGEDDEAVPLFCWIIIDDGKVLVSFDNAEMVARRIEAAEAIYGLSPAQVRLARLIADGKDLTEASDILGVSVNTLRTHVQRMFDRTGVRNQAALVRVLLSAEAPAR